MSVPQTMSPWAQWQDAIFAWVAAGVGGKVPILWEGQSNNPAQPVRPFVTIRLLSETKIGFDGVHTSVLAVSGDGTPLSAQEAYYGERLLTFSVQCFAFETGRLDESAASYCEAIADALNNQDVWGALATAGLGLVDYTDVRNLGEAFGQQMGGRAAFEVTFEGAAGLDTGAIVPSIGEVVGEVDIVLENGSSASFPFDVKEPA